MLRVMRALWGPTAEAGDAGLEGQRLAAIARAMGELLASFRRLPTAGLQLDDLWADPGRLAAQADRWARQLHGLAATEHTTRVALLSDLSNFHGNNLSCDADAIDEP